MERLVDAARLSRGRLYARKGQVVSIEEVKNGVEARVQGTRATPYRVTIQLAPFNDTQWERIIDALAEQALFTAQLLAGEMPQEIDDAFRSAGTSLFPTHRGDLVTSCSCPDWSNPCKHVAAAHYILGERFDEDPFLLFRLRGRSQEQILQALRQQRAGEEQTSQVAQSTALWEEHEIAQPSVEVIKHYYDLAGPLDEFIVAIKTPPIEIPLIKRLGEPTFTEEPGLRYLLLPAYRLVSMEAIQAAYGDAQSPDDKSAANDEHNDNGKGKAY